MPVVAVGVGSNLGAREAAIRAAADLLDARAGIEVCAVSKIYETEPLGPPQPRYLNAALRLQTHVPPSELLSVLLRTERRLGRRRNPAERWGPRSIDLDLLWDERGPHQSPGLLVPHRELQNRDFALGPLLDVVPELAQSLGPSLAELGGAPLLWNREALIQVETSSKGFEVDVEADSLVDACALCVCEPRAPAGRPWSSRHLRIEAGVEQFSAAVHEVVRSGFSIHRSTISHCSKSQWALEFHGVSMGKSAATHVRLWNTSPEHRQFRLRRTALFNP